MTILEYQPREITATLSEVYVPWLTKVYDDTLPNSAASYVNSAAKRLRDSEEEAPSNKYGAALGMKEGVTQLTCVGLDVYPGAFGTFKGSAPPPPKLRERLYQSVNLYESELAVDKRPTGIEVFRLEWGAQLFTPGDPNMPTESSCSVETTSEQDPSTRLLMLQKMRRFLDDHADYQCLYGNKASHVSRLA